MDLDQSGPELAAAFARDGVACVRGVLDPAEIAAAVAAIETVLAAPGPLAQVASGLGDPGSFTEDFRRWEDVPQIEGLARHSRVPRIAAALMGTPQVRFYHDHVLVKEGGTRQRTPWHQDQPYYNVDGHGVSAWIPVNPVPAAGCLELLAGCTAGPGSSRGRSWPGRRSGSRTGAWPNCRTSRPTGTPSTSAASSWSRATRSPSTAGRCTGRRSRSAAAAGCCHCGTCRPMRGTRPDSGTPRRRSMASNPSSRPARPWIIPCSPSSGHRQGGCRHLGFLAPWSGPPGGQPADAAVGRGSRRGTCQFGALILLSLPRWDRLREEPEQSVGEEAAEAVGRPVACRGKAVKDGRVHEQPHDVDGLGAVKAGAQRCLLGEAVDDPPAVTARWALSCAASGTRRSSLRAPSRAASTSASDRSAAGTRIVATASRKAVASGAARADSAHGRSSTGTGSSSPAMATSIAAFSRSGLVGKASSTAATDTSAAAATAATVVPA